MTVKEKAAKVGKRLGFEVILACVFLVLTAAGIVSFYFVGRGVVIAAQDTWFKYTHSYLSPNWPILGYGVLVGWIPSGIIVAVRYFNRRNVQPTLQTMSIDGLNKATAKVEESLAKFEKTDSERWQGMTATMDLLIQRVDEVAKTSDVRMKSIEDTLAGKGFLEKTKDAIASKLPGKGAETT